MARPISTICVFCGSSRGIDLAYAAAARSLGGVLCERKISLVYGGGRVGLMGVLADEVLRLGGEVFGVIPETLAVKELAHGGLTRMFVVSSMHERKARMADLSDGFIALPGGLGTFEELFEVMTWTQLGIYRKSIGILNISGYFDPLVQLIDNAIAQRFLKSEHRSLMLVDEDPAGLLDRMEDHALPALPRWIKTEET